MNNQINKNLPDIVFIGQPNAGKSTIFNALAGTRAETSNFPGTTVTHTHSHINFFGRELNIIDLPGSYSLNPSDEGEKVALTHLFGEKPDMIVNVIDASTLGRSLELTLELIELEYPMVIALNMMDLAEKKGMTISTEHLEKVLGVPVIPMTAVRGRGAKELLDACCDVLDQNRVPFFHPWSRDVEEKVEELMKALPPELPIVANRRFTAIKMIEAENLFFNEMLTELHPALKEKLDNIRNDLKNRHDSEACEVVAAERHHLALKYFENCCTVKHGSQTKLLDRIDDIIMHPFLGYVILAAVFFLFFFIIFKVGNPLEELILGPVAGVRRFLSAQFGIGILFFVLDGLTQGIVGGVAIVLPYLLPLLFLMSFLEDIGYLARAGFMMDTFMHRIGLHGKSVSPLMLGFGCNVPAIVSTRMLESRRDKVITALLIPFIPCSARTTIILALVAFYLGPVWALGFYVGNLFLVALLSRIISFFFKDPSPGMILEIPSLKLPSLKNMLAKSYFQLKSFIKFAWPILIAGSVVLGLFQYFGMDRIINTILSPLVEQALGLPRDLGVTLVFGFLRKELSLIMMLQALGVEYHGLMTVITQSQLVIFTIFISIFIPCIS
ncbi:MAG: ferrous iron transport protein B, partial [Candidatus Aminicenantes bacterium]|nr:ferrous iron transport protein B [Candidatus Aminicenantes bacterium]